ncbi:facilitated trehalose transporter Tret1-like [Chironomus tepperi]|uniref:facilitated trehalose transporter Tret1-like n=1 Tax=Chironomus tepperi TaxID=113505 RepID=UPI00391F24E5
MVSALHLIAYILIAYAYCEVMIMASQFILGVAASGITITIPLFVCEIAEDNIRGALGLMFALMKSFGVIFSLSFGSILKYYYVVWIFMLFPILYLCSTQFWYESSFYKIQLEDEYKAKDSMMFYRGVKSADTNSVQVEFDSLLQFIKFYDGTDGNIKISDFLTKAAKKSIIIGVVLVALVQFSGYSFIIVKAGTIFQHAETISPEIAAIFTEFFQIFGILLSIIFVDSVGRKLMISMSSIGMAAGILIHYLSEHFMTTMNLSIIGLSITIFCGGIGMVSLPYVVISEICPSNIRGTIIALCVTMSWVFTVVVIKLHALFLEAFSADAILYYFIINCILGACFVIFYVPETRKKSLLEICHIMQR